MACFSFASAKHALCYGLFSHGIEFLATFGFSQLFDQIEIFLPDVRRVYLLPLFICPTNSSAGTVFADFGRTAVSPFPFFACGRMPQFMSSGTGKTVCCCKVSKIPRLKLIFLSLISGIGKNRNSAVLQDLLCNSRCFVSGIHWAC